MNPRRWVTLFGKLVDLNVKISSSIEIFDTLTISQMSYWKHPRPSYYVTHGYQGNRSRGFPAKKKSNVSNFSIKLGSSIEIPSWLNFLYILSYGYFSLTFRGAQSSSYAYIAMFQFNIHEISIEKIAWSRSYINIWLSGIARQLDFHKILIDL